MRDYEEDKCIGCKHIKICTIRKSLQKWYKEYEFYLKFNTSVGDKIEEDFLKSLSKWCNEKEKENENEKQN
jgi:hypothetical protein